MLLLPFEVLACRYPTYGNWCFVHGCLAVDAFGCSAVAKWRLRRCLVVLHVYVSGAIKAASLVLLVSDVAHDKGSWPFWLPRPDPSKLSEPERVVERGVASASPQLVVGYATSWADASKT